MVQQEDTTPKKRLCTAVHVTIEDHVTQLRHYNTIIHAIGNSSSGSATPSRNNSVSDLNVKSNLRVIAYYTACVFVCVVVISCFLDASLRLLAYPADERGTLEEGQHDTGWTCLLQHNTEIYTKFTAPRQSEKKTHNTSSENHQYPCTFCWYGRSTRSFPLGSVPMR